MVRIAAICAGELDLLPGPDTMSGRKIVEIGFMNGRPAGIEWAKAVQSMSCGPACKRSKRLDEQERGDGIAQTMP